MIEKLPQELINKIAAGEVVERPNSVVKELIENSIDAGSTEIVIEIEENSISITDNGTGISKNDLQKLFINHSTSKIKDIEDLNSLITLGFRGEAVATISSVSDMKIYSQSIQDKIGHVIDNSKSGIFEYAMNVGTKVEVKNLFYNVPARKKFLKTPSTENKYIVDTVLRHALSHPEIGIKLIINNKIIFALSPENQSQRISKLLPGVKLKELITDDIVSGYIAMPGDTFSKPTYQYMFINNRYFFPSPGLSRAVFTGYKNAIMRGQYPPYVLFIQTDPSYFDVNVHPRKLEVKFENEGYIFQKIYSIIQHTLFRETPIVEDFVEVNHGLPLQTNVNPIQNNIFLPKTSKNFIVSKAMEFTSEILEEKPTIPDVDLGNLNQYINSYILAQENNNIILFDQHACSERYLFEIYKARIEDKLIKTKNLLIPEVIPTQYQDFIWEKKDLIASFGIIIEKENNDMLITAIPEFSNLRIIDKLFAEIQNVFSDDLTSVIELQEKIITTLACHSAIRFGDKLSKDECVRIITDLKTCNNPLTCPHGRPTFYRLDQEKLVQIFKR